VNLCLWVSFIYLIASFVFAVMGLHQFINKKFEVPAGSHRIFIENGYYVEVMKSEDLKVKDKDGNKIDDVTGYLVMRKKK